MNLFLVVLMWGINLPIMKFAFERGIDEFAFNAFRLTLSAMALGLIVWWLKSPVLDRTESAKPVGVQVFQLVIFGFLVAFGYQVLFLMGIASTSAGNTALILSAIPMWIAILSFFMLGERLSGRAWVGLLVAIAGVLVVTLSKQGGEQTPNTFLGNLLVSGAALCWALASVISKPMMKNISPIAFAFYAIVIALPLHFLITRDIGVEFNKVASDPWLLSALCYSGVFSTGLASAMWNLGVKQVGPSHAAGFQNLVPLIAIGASWIMIGEVPFALQLVGGTLIIAGLIFMRIQRGRAPVLVSGSSN